MGRFEIRTMTRGELDFAVDLAANEGWNPGLHDADAFYAADPDGYLVGLLDGEPIGCISAVSYEGVFGFVGFYIVVPEHRGKGYGIQLWDAAMGRLDGHNVGLDGVVAQQDNYRKSGFQYAYANIRYEGRVRSIDVSSEGFKTLSNVSFDQLCAYDRAFFPAGRTAFLDRWTRLPQSTGVACVNGDTMRGYGVIRACRSGHKIGPLFADTPAIAEAIYTHLSASVSSGDSIYLDVPETNANAIALARRHGMTKVFETARMYTGDAPPLPLERLYGVTTFELG
ncbi:MAG: GNAT family N-acetyltransferase [Phycisphaera sp.]|nr:GNAT family N-acetyltransferase [Phycisphaera sp.]